MGYVVNGVCYPDTASALNAFKLTLVQLDTTAVISGRSATIDSSGVVSWSISHRIFTGMGSTVRTGTTALMQCDTPTMSQYSEQSLFFIVAIFFAAIHGLKTGFHSSI